MRERLNVTAGPIPTPFSASCWGLLGALSVRVRLPFRVPGTPGVKTTWMTQLWLASRRPRQAVDCICQKSPVVAMLVTTSGALPTFVRVMGFGALDWPTFTSPKPGPPDGASLTSGATPIPLSGIDSGLPAAPSTIVTKPVIAPIPLGVKRRTMEQLPLGARLEGQSVASAWKSPDAATLWMARGRSPWLVRVVLCGALVVPTD